MTNCDLICVGEWVFLVLWFISVPTYCMVTYTIVANRKRKFKEEFWLFSISLFFADLLHTCQVMWCQKMPAWGYLPTVFLQKPHLFGWLMLAPKPTFVCAQMMGVVFLSLNRYVAIMKPLQYKTLWTRRKSIFCIFTQWIVASIVFLWTMNLQYTLIPNPYSNGSTFIPSIEPQDKKYASLFLGLLIGLGGFVRIPLFVGLYGSMFYRVYKLNRKPTLVRNQQQSSFNRDEFNLAIIGSVLALCDMAITLHVIEVAIQRNTVWGESIRAEKVRSRFFRLSCITDIYGWINGWLLLICCQQVRKQFCKQFGCKKSNKVQTIQIKKRENGQRKNKGKQAMTSRL